MSDSYTEYEINDTTYHWSVRVFSTLERMLKVNIRLHGDCQLLEDGQIFLFNHFSRFETFIPQYLIFRNTAAYCRSVASAEFFAEDDTLAGYLRNVGAVPHNLPGLLPFLAREILHGRKVVLFPEGGMVKDRRVLDEQGRYRVFSPTAGERRRHHSGAAVLATTLDGIKQGLLACRRRGEQRRLASWSEELGFSSVDALLEAVDKPTLIVPANITFYPIRVKDNLLRRGATLFSRGLSRRATEELLVEGNILTRDTDMDIRIGTPIHAPEWRWHTRQLIRHRLRSGAPLESWFETRPARLDSQLLARVMRRRILETRDRYMRGLYTGVTVNLSHLASRLMIDLLDRGITEIDRTRFHRMLYLAVKTCQAEAGLSLHRSLLDPACYAGVLDGRGRWLPQFLEMCRSLELVEVTPESYRFLPKLCAEHEFQTIRMENLVTVYANEVAPLDSVCSALETAENGVTALAGVELANRLFDDELRGYRRDLRHFSRSGYAEVNDRETATADPLPFLLNAHPAPFGVLLVHGFLASPAEVRGLGERLAETGLPVLGIRLRGHGTSPWDLRERSWEDWLDSVDRGYRLLAEFCTRVAVVGFSTGGALALLHAAGQPERLAGVVSISAPMEFANPGMRFVPLVHGANRLTRWLSRDEGLIPFHVHESEHPDINYLQMPIRGLYELRQMADTLAERATQVDCPLLLLQATADPVVAPASAEQLFDRVASRPRRLCWIASDRHGILHEDLGGTQQLVIDFLDELRSTALDRSHEPPEQPDDHLGGLQVEVVPTL